MSDDVQADPQPESPSLMEVFRFQRPPLDSRIKRVERTTPYQRRGSTVASNSAWKNVPSPSIADHTKAVTVDAAGALVYGKVVAAGTPITAATKTKLTYSAHGLVTAGTDATTADIADSTNRRYLTDAEQTIVVTLAASTYTPTLTNVTNLDGSTAYKCQYMRVGAVVTVSGRVDVDPTAAAAVKLGISLPIASTFTLVNDCAGAAFASGVAGQGAAILADTTNFRAEMDWVTLDVTNQAMYFTFTYEVK